MQEDDFGAPSFLFESVVNGDQQGRYSFVGAMPALEVRVCLGSPSFCLVACNLAAVFPVYPSFLQLVFNPPFYHLLSSNTGRSHAEQGGGHGPRSRHAQCDGGG